MKLTHFYRTVPGQRFIILLYGIDAWRKAALYNGIEVVGRGYYPDVVIYLPSKRIDFIATHF